MSVWDTPLYISNVPIHNRVKNPLIDFLCQLRDQKTAEIESEVAVTAKKSLYESDLSLLDNLDKHVQELRAFFEEMIATVATDVNQHFWPEEATASAIITESWCHITESGGYHDAHSHPNCSWCGIYYLDIGDADFESRNGINRFYDPRICSDHYLDAGSQYLNSTGIWDVAPVEGQLVIFPSYLKHSALPYQGDNDRIVIAFNAQVNLI